MLTNGVDFYGIELNDNSIVSLGTPHDVKEYLDNTKVLLFDLDGTLVDTGFCIYKGVVPIVKKI